MSDRQTDEEIKSRIGVFVAKRRAAEHYLSLYPNAVTQKRKLYGANAAIESLLDELKRRGVVLPDEDHPNRAKPQKAIADKRVERLSTFTAKYDGDCPLCPKPIKPGDRCAYADLGKADTDETVIHYACRSEVDGSKRRDPGVMCQECWTIHAGECA